MEYILKKKKYYDPESKGFSLNHALSQESVEFLCLQKYGDSIWHRGSMRARYKGVIDGYAFETGCTQLEAEMLFEEAMGEKARGELAELVGDENVAGEITIITGAFRQAMIDGLTLCRAEIDEYNRRKGEYRKSRKSGEATPKKERKKKEAAPETPKVEEPEADLYRLYFMSAKGRPFNEPFAEVKTRAEVAAIKAEHSTRAIHVEEIRAEAVAV